MINRKTNNKAAHPHAAQEHTCYSSERNLSGSKKPERLQKILSSHGVASRRKAEELIIAGRVTVNGRIAQLGQSAVSGTDKIEVDGKLLAKKEPHIYIMLNKPRGYLTTVSDTDGRKTVMSLTADAGGRLYPVGRLDMNSEGLLLLTNDGAFAQAVAHPSAGKNKTYEVHVAGDAKAAVKKLSKPVMIDGHTVRARNVSIISVTDESAVLRVTIAEGRNRQIRKMCGACNLSVLALKRISIGSLKLGTLASGKWRHLTDEEVRELYS